MDIHSLRSAFDHAVLWVCGLGIAAIALAYAGYLLARFPGKVRRSVRTYGLPTVIALGALMVFAAIDGTPTNEDKERYRQQHQQQGGLPDPGQDGSVPGDPETESDSDADGLSGIMTLELDDDDYGTDGSDGATEGAGTIEAETLTLPDIRPLTESDYAAGIVFSQIGTDETHSFEPIPGAKVCDDWRRFGVARDWFKSTFTNGWSFAFGTNSVDALTVFSYGTTRPSMTNTTTFVSPFHANIGVLPSANDWMLCAPDGLESSWTPIPDPVLPSRFWQALTPSNTFVMCWQNVPWNRDVHYPFSFMIEFEEKGDITFRYDMSRLPDSVVTNVTVGISNGGLGRTFNAIPRDVTSLKFAHLDPTRADDSDPDGDGLTTEDEVLVHHTDPYDADTDKDGLSDGREVNETHTDPLDPHSLDPRYPDGVAIEIGELNPFDSPEGSVHTYWEHLFYTGTTNAPFAYPQSTVDTAVLRVSVSGEGAGELVVDDLVIPLLAMPSLAPLSVDEDDDGAAARNPTNTLLIAIGKGVVKNLWFRKPDGLQLAIDSDDLLIGKLPIAALRPGWIAFPHTNATEPCIHDLDAGEKTVSLVHGEEFPGLTATWSSDAQGVAVTNSPPDSATVYGRFKKDETRSISYRVEHPDILNSDPVFEFTQTMRFYPQLSENEDVSQGNRYEDPQDEAFYSCPCTDGHPCSCCSGEWCHCPNYGCSCNAEREDSVSTNDVEAITVYTNAMDSVLTDANNILYLCRDYRKEISLDVPPPSQRVCCPCPDHHEGSYAAAVTQSRRLEVQHEDGTRFSSTNKTCTVYVKGLSPSRAPNDASVSFMTNGVVNRTSSYTVLGVGFEAPDARVSLQKYGELSADFGCPVLVCTNQARAARLRIKTEVLLTNGVVRLALANATNRVEIWTTEWWDNNSNYHAPELLLRNGDVMQRHFTMREWRSLLQRYWRTTDLDVRIIAPDTGSVDISVEFVSTEGGHRIWDKAVQRLTVVPPLLFPDYNRDGTVDMKDALRWSSDRPAYFWYNDDSWQGDDAFRYGTGRFSLSAPNPLNNGSDGIVNGHNDYVNMLPLRLDVSMLQAAWGMSNIVCEFTTQVPGLVRFLPVSTKWDAIGHFAKSEQYLISGEPITNASFSVTSRHKGGEEIPYEIPAALLDLGAARAGALACEFICRGSLELTCRVRKRESKEILLESPVRVSICDVHRMYRWVNLMGECDPIVPDLPLDSKFNTRIGEPDWPDSEHGNANVVFAHGYNMHPEEAWGWSQALFKRLWWSGIDAGFTAVMWRGNNSQVWIPGKQTYATANYHNNVFSAFKTAGAFAREVNALWGEKKYMIAHSLGNMLVSAARQYHGLEYEKYFMLNAAVPIEAYDPTGGVNDDSKFRMTPADWRGYPDSYRSSHWHDLFEASDARSTLTWSNRFSNVDRTINFYSSRDEVIQNGDGGWKQPISREFAWYNQERAKGSRLVSMSPQAGWVFGDHYKVRYVKRYDRGRPVYAYRPYTLAELNAANVTTEDFKERPLFRDFASSQIYGAEGSEFVRNNDEFYWETLAYGIPAESLATGANVVPAWDSSAARPDGKIKKKKSDRNINMATKCNPKGENAEPLDWIHSYFIQQSLFDTKILYRKIVDFTKAP